MNCIAFASKANMANKMKMLTLLQEMRGYAQITNRRSEPKPSFLYLMKLRAQAAKTSVPRRRLAISVTSSGSVNVALPVKITHVKRENAALRVFAR